MGISKFVFLFFLKKEVYDQNGAVWGYIKKKPQKIQPLSLRTTTLNSSVSNYIVPDGAAYMRALSFLGQLIQEAPAQAWKPKKIYCNEYKILSFTQFSSTISPMLFQLYNTKSIAMNGQLYQEAINAKKSDQI